MKIEAHFADGEMQIELIPANDTEKKFLELFKGFESVGVMLVNKPRHEFDYGYGDTEKLVLRLVEKKPVPAIGPADGGPE